MIPLIRPKIDTSHGKKILQWDAALAEHPGDRLTFDIPPGGRERVAAYFHTGGTTGDPKLATHKIGGMIFIGHVVKEGVLNEGDVILCALPLFHCFGAYVMGLTSPMNGGRLVLMTPAGFRGEGVIDNFWALVARYKVNFFMSVPTALAALNQRPVGDADVSSLTYTVCGSAPLPVELFKQFESKTGIKILEGYGQTEATVVCSVNPPDGERKIGSVGFPLPYTRMKMLHIDDHGVCTGEAEEDQIGEICISGPHVFPGYKDIAREKVFVKGPDGKEWLRSGDLGRVDPDGYYWITGPRERPDHSRRPQHRPRYGRRGDHAPSGGCDGRGDRPARRLCGRAALRLCRAERGRDGHARRTRRLRQGACARARGPSGLRRDP